MHELFLAPCEWEDKSIWSWENVIGVTTANLFVAFYCYTREKSPKNMFGMPINCSVSLLKNLRTSMFSANQNTCICFDNGAMQDQVWKGITWIPILCTLNWSWVQGFQVHGQMMKGDRVWPVLLSVLEHPKWGRQAQPIPRKLLNQEHKLLFADWHAIDQ